MLYVYRAKCVKHLLIISCGWPLKYSKKRHREIHRPTHHDDGALALQDDYYCLVATW